MDAITKSDTHTLRVLLVEDDEDDYLLTRELLAEIGGRRFDLEWISSYGEAVGKIGENHYDVCLVDYRLGEQNGLDLIREASRSGCDAGLILLTGQDSRELAVEVMKEGAADYLVKGQITAPMLDRTIRYAMARRRFQRVEAQANKELKEKNRRLSELYKTAHQFVDNVSHEFRTPLTVIKEFASIMRDGLAGDITDQQREFLGIIINRVEDLGIMVDDMLDVSRLEAGMLTVSRKECRPESIVDPLRVILERKAAASTVNVEIAIDDGLPAIYCDAEKIGRVIINLAINAIKFSGEGGRVILRARHDVEASQIVFSVTDDGPGIAPESVQAIFERFKQVEGDVRATAKGFGLGLNIARELVHLNFGDISVESEVGKGSTFSFTVPTADPLRLLERYLRRIEQFRNGSSFVSLLRVQVTANVAEVLLDDVEQFLQHNLRRGDLMFRIQANAWLVAAATNQQELDQMVHRLRENQREANRNRPGDKLPAVDFEVRGTWRVVDQSGDFLERFAADYFGRDSAPVRTEPRQETSVAR